MKAFIDTNVFLYAFLDQDVAKKAIAATLLAQLVRDGNGFVSLQVAKEFCSVMLRRSKKSAAEIAAATSLFGRYHLVDGSLDCVRRALVIKERFGLQFYDSLLLVAAETAGCDTILTEDFSDGQVYNGVRAVNPFKDTTSTSSTPLHG